jgi:prepilin-type N-terminal cleavage/methylation domain-containing protein
MNARRPEGFSLLEVMVALFVTALCLGLVTASLGSVLRANSRAIEHLDLLQTQTETLERMRSYLLAAYLSPYPVNQLQTEFLAMDLDNSSEPYDALTFSTLAITTHRINGREPDLANVTLFTTDEPALEVDGKRLRLRRLRLRVGGEINDRFEVDGGMVYTLADHVTRLQFEYLDTDGDWKKEWDVVDHQNQLPCAIRVTFGLRTQNLAESVSTVTVPVEMTGLNCRWDEGKVFEQ